MTNEILLSADLDRTVLPNGLQPESPEARPRLRALARHPEVKLAYVTGRHKALLLEGIEEYQVPMPDYAIGDVGTTIYEIRDGAWNPWEKWYEDIAPSWVGRRHEDLRKLFEDFTSLQLQESEKQNTFKLSYYAPTGMDSNALVDRMQQRLKREGVRASIIWSVDETTDTGLIDVLPERATKRHAIEFLIKNKGFGRDNTVFAGDSGNDLPALTGGLQAVLVKNATEEVRKEAIDRAKRNGCEHRLYLARGGFLEMNGNYAAGVVEGVVHFLPRTLHWVET